MSATLQTVVGVVEDYGAKELASGSTKYGAKIKGAWYSSFSDSDGKTLADAKESGQPVSVSYKVHGQYNNIDDVELMGEAPAPAASTAGQQSAAPPAAAPPESGHKLHEQTVSVGGGKVIDLSEYERQGFLVIYPTESYIREISERLVVRLETIYPKEDDFYDQGSGHAPNKQLLLKISDAGGLYWDPDRCGYETNQPTLKVFKAVGNIRQADGMLKSVIGHKEIDLEVEIAEIEDRAANLMKGYKNNRREATEEEKAQYVKSETLRLKKHAGSNCETKAYLRAVRAAFQLPGTFTSEEIRKAWLIPRIDFQPDYNDPQVQSQLIDRGQGAAAEMYAGSHTPPAPADYEEPAAVGAEGGVDDCPF